jgi:hypothetical protein
MSKTVLVIVAAVAASMAVPAAAGWHVSGVHGASCSTDPRTTVSWEYRGPRIINTDHDPFGVLVAVCPVNVFAPGNEPYEYRIILTDPAEGRVSCRMYAGDGTLVRRQFANWDAGFPIAGSFPVSVGATGYVEMTLHCLLTSGASLDKIEIVWSTP